MKQLIYILAFLTSASVFSQQDFVLTINNKTYEVSLDEAYEFDVDGKSIELSITEKDTLLFDESFYSFNYIKSHQISRTEIEKGIEQIMMVTATGSGVLIQKYDSFDPTMLQEMMLNEVTKESVSYGYNIERKDYEKTLSSGQIIKILKAELEYKGEYETYEISAFGRKDEGILIMTMNILDDINEDGKNMIGLMWESLNIKG